MPQPQQKKIARRERIEGQRSPKFRHRRLGCQRQAADFVAPERAGAKKENGVKRDQEYREQTRSRQFTAREYFLGQESLHANRVRAAAPKQSSQIIAHKIDSPPPRTSHGGR